MRMSSLGSSRLAHRLSCDVGQVTFFVIRRLVSPHHKDNLQPLGAEGAQGLVIGVALATLLTVIGRGPRAVPQGKEGQPVDGMTQALVAGEPKVHHAALATALGNRYRACLPLKVLKEPALSAAEGNPNGQERHPTLPTSWVQ